MMTILKVGVRGLTASLLTGALTAAACGSSSTPVTPTGTCRTFPTAVTTTTVPQTILNNAVTVQNFNTTTNELTATTSSVGGVVCSITVSTYNSRADFVDEVKVIPPVSLLTESRTTNTGACGTGSVDIRYEYDTQRRLLHVINNGVLVASYAAWDSSGRPTGGGTTSIVYNSSARTQVQTLSPAGAASQTTTTTFDLDGNVVSILNNTTGQSTNFANGSTTSACK
jgi:hypothetical protein